MTWRIEFEKKRLRQHERKDKGECARAAGPRRSLAWGPCSSTRCAQWPAITQSACMNPAGVEDVRANQRARLRPDSCQALPTVEDVGA